MTTYGGPPPASTPPGNPGFYAPKAEVSFDVIGEAWNLVKLQLGSWIGALVICAIVYFVTYMACIFAMVPVLIATGGHNSGGGFNLLAMLMQLMVTVVITSVVYLLMGGLYRMAIKQVRGEAPTISDLFSVTDVMLPLLGVSLLIGVLSNIGLAFCILPGLVVMGLSMFAIPLVVDQRLGAIAALSQSINMLKSNWLMATVFYFVVALIGILGGLACGFGLLITFPIFITSVALTYRNFMGGGGGAPVMGGMSPMVPGGNVVTPTPGFNAPMGGGFTAPTSGGYTAPTSGGYTAPNMNAETPAPGNAGVYGTPPAAPQAGYTPQTGYVPPAAPLNGEDNMGGSSTSPNGPTQR